MSAEFLELLVAKLVASVALTAASVLGMVAPFWCFRWLCALPSAHAHGVTQEMSERKKHTPTEDELSLALEGVAAPPLGGIAGDEKSTLMISYANCISAGILLWTGLMHFFVEGVEGFTLLAQQARTATADTSPLCSASELEAGVGRAVMWFLLGVFVPLVVERVVWPYVTELLLSPSAPSRHTEDQSVAVLMSAHAHSHGHSQHHHPHVAQGENVSAAVKAGGVRPKDLAAAMLIAILMSVHSATEGVAIGVEQSVQAVRQSVAPLLVHKIFDGWLVGLGAYRGVDSSIRNGATLGAIRHVLFRSAQRYALWVWLVALPGTLIAVGFMVSPHAKSPGTGAADSPHHHQGSASATVAAAQAASSGSFLYVAVCAILVEELSASDAFVDAQRKVKRNLILVTGALFGLLMGSVLASAE